MKRFALLLVLLLIPALCLASPQSFIDGLAPHLDIVADAGLFPSVYIAMAALETGWGRSEAGRWNNYWGIKCMGPPCFAKKTWEIYDGKYWEGKLLFQAFPDLKTATQAYCRKILWQREYQNVEYSSRDAHIDSLAKVWATDPDYAWKIKSIIKVWKLEQFDSDAEAP